MWAEFVTLVWRMLLVSTIFASVLGCPWPLSSLYSLVRVCHRFFSRPILPILTSHIAVGVPTSAGPFLPHGLSISSLTVSHCHDVHFVGSLPSAFITLSLHTTWSILPSIFRWQVLSILFSFFVSDHVWTPHNTIGNMQDSRTSFFISRFWNLSARTNHRLLNLCQVIPTLFLVSLSWVILEWYQLTYILYKQQSSPKS